MKVYRCKVSRSDSPEFELIVPLAAGYALLDVLEQELSSDEFTTMSIVVSDIGIGSEV